MGDKKVIFLADDEQSIRKSLKTLFEAFGWGFVGFSKGEDVWEEVKDKDQGFDVLITDWDMNSQMDGIALIKKVREKFPTVPIILMSANDCPDGCPTDDNFSFAQKPVPFSELERIVKKLLKI